MSFNSRHRHDHLNFYNLYHTKSSPSLNGSESAEHMLGVIGEEVPRFCDLRLAPEERLAATFHIATLLPEELAFVDYSPQRTVGSIAIQLIEHPRYAFDQDAMSAMIRTGTALSIWHGYDARIVDAVVRGLNRYGSVPRSLGKVQVEEAVYSAQVSRWAEAVDKTRQMGAEADLLTAGQRFAVLVGRMRERRNG